MEPRAPVGVLMFRLAGAHATLLTVFSMIPLPFPASLKSGREALLQGAAIYRRGDPRPVIPGWMLPACRPCQDSLKSPQEQRQLRFWVLVSSVTCAHL